MKNKSKTRKLSEAQANASNKVARSCSLRGCQRFFRPTSERSKVKPRKLIPDYFGWKDFRIIQCYSKTKPQSRRYFFVFRKLLSCSKDCMYNEVWGYIEILHFRLSTEFTPYTLHRYAYSPFCSQPFSKVPTRRICLAIKSFFSR